MEDAGAITFSPADQALFLAVFLGVIVVLAALIGAAIGGLIGSARQPSQAIRYAGTTAMAILVAGTVLTVIAALSVAAQPGPNTGGASPRTWGSAPATTKAPPTSRKPVSVPLPPDMIACSRTEWIARVATVSPGRVSLLLCTPDDVVVDVDTTVEPTHPTGIRSFWHRTGSGEWQNIAVDAGPGCGPVATIEPAFPLRICRDLPLPLSGKDQMTMELPSSLPTTTRA